MEIINLTPHEIVTEGNTYPASGKIARCRVDFFPEFIRTQNRGNGESFYRAEYDEAHLIENNDKTTPLPLPVEREGVYFIVSGMVKNACPEREDFISPATGHRDCKRDQKGRIISVPGFII